MQKISDANFREPMTLMGSNYKQADYMHSASAKKNYGYKLMDEPNLNCVTKFDLSGLESVKE